MGQIGPRSVARGRTQYGGGGPSERSLGRGWSCRIGSHAGGTQVPDRADLSLNHQSAGG